jgi:hypothetical protein
MQQCTVNHGAIIVRCKFLSELSGVGPEFSSIVRDWTPNLIANDKPRYLAIADAIADDIRSGRLAALGGPADRTAVRSALEFMAHALAESPTLASTFL